MINFRSVLFYVLLVLPLIATFAQESHHDEYIDQVQRNRFRYGLNAGLAFPNSKKIGGIEADFDVRFRVTEKINVGGRIGWADIKKNEGTRGDAVNNYYTSTVIVSGLVHSDYYFYEYPKYFAPFVGLGFGVFDVSSISIKTGDNVITSRNYAVEYKFGGVIRGGFEYRRFRLALEFNLIPSTKLYDQLGNTPPTYIKDVIPNSNNYLSLRIGFFLGGRAWGDDHRD